MGLPARVSRMDAKIACAVQARKVLRRVRGTDDIGLEFDDICTASAVSAQASVAILGLVSHGPHFCMYK